MANSSEPSGKIDEESMADIKAAFNYLEPLIVCREGFRRFKKENRRKEPKTETEEKSTEEKILLIMESTRNFFCHLCFYNEDIFDKMMFNIWHLYKEFGVDLLGDKEWKEVKNDKSGSKHEKSLSTQLNLLKEHLNKTAVQKLSQVEYFYFEENADYNNPAKINPVNVDDINKDLKTIIEDGSWWGETDPNDENAIEKICDCLGYYLPRLVESLNNEQKTNTERWVKHEGKISDIKNIETPTNAANENTTADIRDEFNLLDPLIQCAALLERNRTWEKSDKKIIGLIIISTRNVLCQRFIKKEIFNKMTLNICHLYKVFGVDLLELKEGKENQKKILKNIRKINPELNTDKYFYWDTFQDFFGKLECKEVAVDVINDKLDKIIEEAESLLKDDKPWKEKQKKDLNEIQKKCWYFGYHLHYLVATRENDWKPKTNRFTKNSEQFFQQISKDMASKIISVNVETVTASR